jgi:hypothetical protein
VGNDLHRKMEDTNTAWPAYRKPYWAQAEDGAGNGIREALETAPSEKKPSTGNSARHPDHWKRWPGEKKKDVR